MELIEYIHLVRRWFWLIFIGAFVAGSVGFIVRSSQAPIFQAESKVIIGSILSNPDPDSRDIYTPADLTATYIDLTTTRSVLEGTIDTLDLVMSVDELRDSINTRTVPNTSLLVIAVKHVDPILAADIANELTNQLILKSPTNLTSEQQAQIDIANRQIQLLTGQIDTLQVQIEQIDARLGEIGDTSSVERDDLERRRSEVVNQLNQSTATIATFNDTITKLQQRTGSLEIIEVATIPVDPIGASTANATILSTMVGASLAFGGALLIEYMSDSFRSADEVVNFLQLPILGVISRIGKPKDSYNSRLVSHPETLETRAMEEYRNLRTNMMFSTQTGQNRIYLVTSPGPGEGKSVTSSNLAISMAMAGTKVLLIDTDLRRPRIHEIFGLDNEMGLTSLLSISAPEDGALPIMHDNSWKRCIHDTGTPNLQVIPSGYISNKPTELLGSVTFKYWLNVFQKQLGVQVIIFDTPPCLIVSDSVVLSTSVESNIVMVLKAGSTRRSSAQKAKERFAAVERELMGVILNGTDPREESYYGYYSYTYYDDAQ